MKLGWCPLLAALACSCGGSTSPSTPAPDASAPACNRAAGLADGGIAKTVCASGRAFVVCTSPGGAGEICLSDDPTACPGFAATSCTNECTASEYGVSCGGPGPGQAPAPPAGCRATRYGPAGTAFYCCPCL